MTEEDLRGIKDVIREDGPEHFSERGININGFFVLHKRMIEMLKIKNCWVIFWSFSRLIFTF